MKNKKLLAVLALTGAIILCANGCGIDQTVKINNDLSSNVSMAIYLTPEELNEMEMDMDTEDLTETTVNGKTYYMEKESESLNANDTKDLFASLTKSKMEFPTVNNALTTEDMELTEEETEQLRESIDFSTISFTLPKKVLKTNGTLSADQKTVTYNALTLQNDVRLYAAMSQEAIDSKIIKYSGVKNKGIYNKTKTIKITSPGVITSLKVNGQEQEENFYKATKSKKYTVKVKLLSGKTKVIKFTIDKVKPKVNIKNKTYKKAVTIKFSDKLSGIKKATLNGQKIKNKKTVKANGNYTLKVTDKAGNVTTVKFKIKK